MPAIAPHDGQVAVIVELHLQVVLVDEVVVATAQQHEIDVVGGPAMAPVAHVMGVAVADLAIAAGESAATIAGAFMCAPCPCPGKTRTVAFGSASATTLAMLAKFGVVAAPTSSNTTSQSLRLARLAPSPIRKGVISR